MSSREREWWGEIGKADDDGSGMNRCRNGSLVNSEKDNREPKNNSGTGRSKRKEKKKKLRKKRKEKKRR